MSYFSSLDPQLLFKALPGNIAQGIIWGIMALGIYITFRLLDFADLTVDGSFATGGAVTIMLTIAGVPIPVALLVAVIAGLIAGLITGLLHTALGIPPILAGILTQIALYSINLHIMDMSPNKPLNIMKFHPIISQRYLFKAIIIGSIFAIALIAILYWYFGTEQGSSIRATGTNPSMSKANGININFTKVLALSISNGIVCLAGGLIAQFQGYTDINMGRGAIVIGLAAVIIGEVFGDALLRRHMNFAFRLLFVVLGGVIYYIVVGVVLWLKLNSSDLRLFTAIIVAAFLAVPYLQRKRKNSFGKTAKASLLTLKAQQDKEVQ
jgi:ABC-type uncharacterized transport system, permease component